MDADFLLICRMKSGDEQAIELFVRKYYPSILRYCRFHLEDHGYAEDMTQEVFARFFRTLNRYQHYGKALNYLYVIAANLCRDYGRRPKEIPMEEVPEPPLTDMEPLELRLDVHTAVKKLPKELREVTALFFFQGCRQKEIAKILGISVPLVKYRLKRARECLAGYLGEEEAK